MYAKDGILLKTNKISTNKSTKRQTLRIEQNKIVANITAMSTTQIGLTKTVSFSFSNFQGKQSSLIFQNYVQILASGVSISHTLYKTPIPLCDHFLFYH
jgi:ABC-type maltose transport system permease subunit